MLGTPTPTVSEKSKREMARAYAVVCSAEIPVERPYMMAVTEAVCRHLLHLPNLFLITQANLYIQSKAETDIERERERESKRAERRGRQKSNKQILGIICWPRTSRNTASGQAGRKAGRQAS